MPDITATAPDGTTHSFPDGTDPAVVDRVMKAYITGKNKPVTASTTTPSKPTAPAPLVTDRKTIDDYRLKYFNTDNPDANVPMKTASALAKNPNDPQVLQRLSSMSAVGQTAIREKAAEIKAENDRTKAYIDKVEKADWLERISQAGDMIGGGSAVNMIQYQGYKAQSDVPGFDPSAAFKGPEGARQGKMTGHGALDPSLNVLADFAGFAATPEGAAFGQAMGTIGALGTAGRVAVAAAGVGMAGQDAATRYKKGDKQGAATSAALGLLGLGLHGISEHVAETKALNTLKNPDLSAIERTRGAEGQPSAVVKPTPKIDFDLHTPSKSTEPLEIDPTSAPKSPREQRIQKIADAFDKDQEKKERDKATTARMFPNAVPEKKPASSAGAITSDQVSALSKDGFTKAADLYAEAKKTEPNLTRDELARRLYEFHKGDTHNYEGPSGNAKPEDIFTLNRGSEKPIRYFGFSEKTTPKPAAPDRSFSIAEEEPKSPDQPLQTKVANAAMQAERRRYGLPDFPDHTPESQAATREEAYSKGMHEQSLQTARELIVKPRPMTDLETAASQMKQHQVKTEMDSLIDQVDEGIAKGEDTSDLQRRYDVLNHQYDELTTAANVTGTESGRAFAMRQNELDDYTLAGIRKTVRMGNPEEPLTPEIEKNVTDVAKQIRETNKAEEVHSEKTPEEFEEEKATQKVVDRMKSAEQRAGRRQVRTEVKAKLDEQMEQLHRKLRAALNNKSQMALPGAMDPKILPILRDMAANRVKAGAVTVSDLIDTLHEHVTETLPDVTKRQLRDALSGYDKTKRIPPTTQLGDMKEQMRWMSKIEDIDQPLPKSAPRSVSNAVAKLREEYKAAKDAKENGTPQAPKSPEEIEQARIEKHIESLKKTLSGDVQATPKLTTVDTEEMQGLRQEEKDLSKKLAERKKAAGPAPPSLEDVEQVRMQKRLEEVQEKIKNGDLSTKSRPKLVTVDTESKAKVRAELANAEKQLSDMRKAAKPKADPLDTYKKSLQTQIDSLQKQLDTGKPTEKQKIAYDAEADRLRETRGRLQKQASALARSRMPKTRLQKLTAYRRAVALSYVSTFGKLAGASLHGLAITPVDEAAGKVLHAIPAYGRIAAKAPHGTPSARGLVRGWTAFASRDSIMQAVQKLKTGQNRMDVLHGDKAETETDKLSWMNLGGRLHGAAKTPMQNAAFESSMVQQAEHVKRIGGDPSDSVTKAGMEASAYQKSKEAILMQDNMMVDLYRGVLNSLVNNKNHPTAGKWAAAALQSDMPIVKVPTNYAGQVIRRTPGIGLIEPAVRVAAAKMRAVDPKASIGTKAMQFAMSKAADHLTPAEADIVVSALRKNMVGTALFALGYYNYDKFGGYYHKGGNGTNDMNPGDMRVNLFGHEFDVWHTFLHAPHIEAMTMGASYRQAVNRSKSGDANQRFQEGAFADVMGVGESIPFVDAPLRAAKAADNANAATTFIGQQAGSMVSPGILKEGAEALDRDERGKVKRRRPKGLWQGFESATPARGLVPVN
jgi:hypothetical protein